MGRDRQLPTRGMGWRGHIEAKPDLRIGWRSLPDGVHTPAGQPGGLKAVKGVLGDIQGCPSFCNRNIAQPQMHGSALHTWSLCLLAFLRWSWHSNYGQFFLFTLLGLRQRNTMQPVIDLGITRETAAEQLPLQFLNLDLV